MGFYNKYIFYQNSYLKLYKNKKIYTKWIEYKKYKKIYNLLLILVCILFIRIS